MAGTFPSGCIREKEKKKQVLLKSFRAFGHGTSVFIKEDSRIPKKILLIDDIYTTGATVNRVKSMLENAGAEEVRTFSLVR